MDMTIDHDDDEPDPVIITATIERVTDRALLVFNHDANESQWVPRSCVSGGDMMDVDEDYDDFELSFWKAEELGWSE